MPVRRPLAALLGTLALLVVLGSQPAAAGRQWCRRDPIVVIAGTPVNIEVGLPEESQCTVTGPIKVVVYVPVGVGTEVTFVDAGFNGHGEHVQVVPSRQLQVRRSGVQIKVEVTVPASRSDVPVAAWVTPTKGRAASVVGRTNQTVRVSSASVVPST